MRACLTGKGPSCNLVMGPRSRSVLVEDNLACFKGQLEEDFPKGPKIEKNQSRLKISISTEDVNLRFNISILTF